jgi:hypothetical protein
MSTNHLESQIRAALAASPAQLLLGAIDDVPLAFHVPLPGQAFGNGHLSIRFDQLALTGLGDVRLASAARAGGATITVRWPRAELVGAYAVTALPAPRLDLDTGGTMLDDDDDIEPGGGGGAQEAPLDPATRDAMLDNARAQRTRLMDDPNGQALMSHYDEHNEIYNTVFVTSAAARGAWAANGATKAMALDTHAAVDANGTVNDPTRTYGTQGVTYNENAFNQQLQIVVNTIATDPNFDPFDPNAKLDPDSPYTKASLAALTFGNAVGQTGNSKATVTPLARDAVYGAVQTGTTPTPATVDELQNIINQGAQPGGGAAALAAARGWRVLDEDDRAKVRRYLRVAAQERAERLTRPRLVLWAGACGAELLDVEAELEVEAADGPGGLRLTACALRLPAFGFAIDDAAWDGDAATVARQRLARLYFVRSLIADHVQGALARHLAERLGGAP